MRQRMTPSAARMPGSRARWHAPASRRRESRDAISNSTPTAPRTHHHPAACAADEMIPPRNHACGDHNYAVLSANDFRCPQRGRERRAARGPEEFARYSKGASIAGFAACVLQVKCRGRYCGHTVEGWLLFTPGEIRLRSAASRAPRRVARRLTSLFTHDITQSVRRIATHGARPRQPSRE
jgi:hypothetical protein